MNANLQDTSLEHNKTITNVIYALYACSLVVGVTFFVAIVLNYVKRDDVVGSFLESHFRWQIRTFWYAFLWMALLFIFSALLAIIFVGFAVWYVGALLLGAWVIYRVARGWMTLRDRIPMS